MNSCQVYFINIERIFNWSQINSLKRSASFGTLPDSSTEFYSAEFPTIKKQFSSTQVQKSDNLECLVKSHSTSSQVLKSDNQKNATLIAKSHSQPAPTVDKKIDNNKAIFSIESDSESDSEKHLVKNTPAEPSVPFVYKLPKKKVVNETSAVCNSQELMQFVEESSQMSDNNNKDSFQSSFHSQEFLATSTQLLVSVEQDKISKVDKTHDSVSMDILLSNSADPIELSLQNSESILSNSAEDPLQKSASLESIFEFQSQEFATDRVNDDIMDEGNTQFFNAEESISSFSKVLQTQDFIDDPISQMSNVMELSNESPLKVRPEDEDDYASQIDSDKEGVEYLEVAEEVLTASFSKETDLDEIQVRKDPSSTSSDSCNSFMEDTQEGGNQGLIGSFVNGLIDTFSFKGKKSDIETVNKDEANDTISNAKDSSIEFLPGVDLKSIEKMDIYSGNFAKSVEPVEKSEISNTNLIVGVDRHLITETTGFDHVFEDSAAVYALKHFSFNLALVLTNIIL